MAKVLFMSDSHGLTREITQIKNQVNVDYLVHCGDSELEMEQLDGFVSVRGNCDYDNRLPNEQTFETGGLKFFIAHGHLHEVKRGINTISYRAEELNARIVVFGHTHVAGVEKIGNQLFINPGSIRLPRGIQVKTYAIMEWDNLEEITVSFFSLDGEIVEQLSFKGSLS